jgi:hypothetical protein
MHHFQGEPGSRRSIAQIMDRLASFGRLSDRPERLAGQLRGTASCRIAGWNRDHPKGQPISWYRRMNKSQQMRWSRRGADLLLQVRRVVYNGTFDADQGQKFQPANDVSIPIRLIWSTDGLLC